jgi:hypothetical protein
MTGVHEGPDGIREFFREIEDAGPDFRIEIERVQVVGERIRRVRVFADRDAALDAVFRAR